MKEFDYEKAKVGAAVCTKDGNTVRIVCWDADIRFDGNTYPILALVSRYKDKVADEAPVSYTEDGKELRGRDSRLDLAMVPVKHEGWVNIYMSEDGVKEAGEYLGRNIFESEKIAKESALSGDYIATAHIEWEE